MNILLIFTIKIKFNTCPNIQGLTRHFKYLPINQWSFQKEYRKFNEYKYILCVFYYTGKNIKIKYMFIYTYLGISIRK